MIRFGVMIVGATATALLAGCAHAPARTPRRDHSDMPTLAVHREYATRPVASALAFSPPFVEDAPPLELSRDLRQPGAFMGYPESTAEFFYVRWDDRQVGGDGSGFGFRGGGRSGSRDRYERRAISEKTGVLYR